MDAEVIKALLLPWWKVPVYILSIAVAVTTIRIGIKFDVNDWMATRRSHKILQDNMKAVKSCCHAWTLYHSSQYSVCNSCMALIATSTLLAAFHSGGNYRPIIFGERHGVSINTRKGSIVVSDWGGGS